MTLEIRDRIRTVVDGSALPENNLCLHADEIQQPVESIQRAHRHFYFLFCFTQVPGGKKKQKRLELNI